MEHRLVPLADVHYKNSVFNQMFDGLKPRDPSQKPLDFRFVFTFWTQIFIAFCQNLIAFFFTFAFPLFVKYVLFYIQNCDSDI